MTVKTTYIAFLALFSVFVFIVKRTLSEQSTSKTTASPQFTRFQRKYLLIFCLVWMADWLQGPYVYALYASYDYSIDEIGLLFIVGFATAGVCGVFVGALADRMGRKKACLAYGLIYAGACVTKHYKNYSVLMLGRLLGGTATSLLYTVFESWMVSTHRSNSFDDALLGTTFTKSGQLNGIVAVAAGVFASNAADTWGPVAPFDLSIISLLISLVFVSQLQENYGQSQRSVTTITMRGLTTLIQNPAVLLLGLSQSFFEGGMFIFVFMWTPALEEVAGEGNKIPHGYIFACFMVSCILGSTIFGYLSTRGVRIELLSFGNYVVAITFLFCSAYESFLFRNVAFLGFEACVGFFWPCAMTLRGKYIPEEVRATIMNFFRIPLNIIVVVVLLRVNSLPVQVVLGLCSACMLVAALCQYYLVRESRTSKYSKVPQASAEEDDDLNGMVQVNHAPTEETI